MTQPQPTKQSPHWADVIAESIATWQKKQNVQKLHVDDMKTPSGRIHTGSLRGVLLHDVIAQVLARQHSTVTSTYVFNDMDPMDGLPAYLDASKYQEHMGKPLYQIPKPNLADCGMDLSQATSEEIKDFENAKNFAELYALDFVHAMRKLGCKQEIVWSHELYESGEMDNSIRIALDSIDAIKKVYREVAEYELPEKWFPFQVICEQCGKVGTTTVSDWDGEVVTYSCEQNKVEWAKGCGHTASVSPFGGTGKLLWKVDWPAHWHTMGVTIEGAGKDHTSAGGSRDMADALCKEVFNIPVPFDIPYEWILVRGAKMSSSKGVGTSAREFTSLFPPQVGRFLFIAREYRQVIDFDPTSMAIPDLYDEYDTGARIFWGQEEGDQRLARAFELSQIDEIPKPEFLPRFRDVALWMQHPEIDLVEKLAEVKGSPLSKVEINTLNSTIKYAKIWVEKYAPEEYQLGAKEDLPESAKNLSPEQKEFFNQAIELTGSKEWDPQDLQQALFDLAKETVGPRKGFQSIYQAFLGKNAGPRAAWFLLSIDPDLRKTRAGQLWED